VENLLLICYVYFYPTEVTAPIIMRGLSVRSNMELSSWYVRR